MQEVESAQMRVGRRLLGGKQYNSRSGSAGKSRVEEAGGEEGRDESVVWEDSKGWKRVDW